MEKGNADRLLPIAPESIERTLRFYVGTDAQRTADAALSST